MIGLIGKKLGMTRRFQEDGRFVTFPGYEWSGNTGLGGDRNVLYRSEGRPIHRSSHALVEDLLDTMQAEDGAGLAAPQIGVMLRLAVVDCSAERGNAVLLADPEIEEASPELRAST